MIYRKVNISLPADLLKELDEAARAEFITRSAYIREALTSRIKLDSYIENEYKNSDSDYSVIRKAHLYKAIRIGMNKDRKR